MFPFSTSFINAVLVIAALPLYGETGGFFHADCSGGISTQLARGFKVCIILAAAQGCSSVVIGIIISILSNLPASATIVMVNLLFFSAAFVTRRIIYPKNSN
jgi:hypothetical protein